MNLIKKITAGTLALVLATGLAGSVLAESDKGSGDLLVKINPMDGGSLSASIDGYEFHALNYKIEDQTASGTLVVKASDLRGKASGWNVTVTGTDFNGDSEFGISNLGLSGSSVGTDSETGHSTEAQPTQSDVQSVSNGTESTILTAVPDTGAGHYTATYDASLKVPAGTLIGDYKATVTVTISGDQPGDPSDGK